MVSTKSPLRLAIGLMCAVAPAVAAVFCVSTAQDLQTALTTAAANGQGDRILLVQGTYQGNFIYGTVESGELAVEGGYAAGCTSRVVNPGNTILDGMGLATVLALSTNTASTLRVDGITVRNGLATSGSGGGLYLGSAGDVVVAKSVAEQNLAVNGAGVWASAANITISDSRFANNGSGQCCGNGGGVYATGGNITISGSTITANRAYYGGGLYAAGVVTVKNTLFNGNTAEWSGGGATITGYAPSQLTDNLFDGNTLVNVDGRGGGLYLAAYSGTVPPKITNNIFLRNSASYGGGLYVEGDSPVSLINNTIVYNSFGVANPRGGGVSLLLRNEAAPVDIYNNIIWGNVTVAPPASRAPLPFRPPAPRTGAAAANDLYVDNDGDGDFVPTPVNLFNNDFDQSAAGTYIKIPFPVSPTNLNNLDPLFVAPGAGDLRLNANSPVINKGSNSAPNLPATDKLGNPRIAQGTVDMGATEYTPCVIGLQLQYQPQVLGMTIDIGTTKAALWSTLLASQYGLQPLWSQAIPVIDPPVRFPLNIPGFPQMGNIGILSVLSASPQGLMCFDFETINTGGPAGATVQQLYDLVRSHGYPVASPKP